MFTPNHFFVFAERDAFFISKGAGCPIIKYPIQSNNPIPNVPFFHYVWENEKTSVSNFRRFLRREIKLSILFKPKVFVVLPDDVVDVDIRCIVDFFMLCGAKLVIISNQHQLLGPGGLNYISVTMSDRNICVKSTLLPGIEYLPRNITDPEILKDAVDKMISERYSETLPVYLYGINTDMFQSIGQTVSMEQAIERLETGIK